MELIKDIIILSSSLDIYNNINIIEAITKKQINIIDELYKLSNLPDVNIIEKIILDVLNNIIKDKPKDKRWIYCGKPCLIHIIPLVQYEIYSTLYILNVLSNSLISINKSYIFFEINKKNIKKLNGKWINDNIYFTMKISDDL